jgi:hypothetical protein
VHAGYLLPQHGLSAAYWEPIRTAMSMKRRSRSPAFLRHLFHIGYSLNFYSRNRDYARESPASSIVA